MNKNALAIKSAVARQREIDVILYIGAVKLEEVESKLAYRNTVVFGGRNLTANQREALELKKGKLEDQQAELSGESEDLQKYMDKLLDPEAAWPEFDEQERRLLCGAERANISRYTKGKGLL